MAPADVDTLRDEECPICGEATSYDGNECMICGFVQPPKAFQDPDLDLAQKLDLRKDDADPNGMNVSDVDGIEDSINDADRDGLDDETGEPMGMGGDPEMGQDPDLVCPVCGEGFSSKPTSVSMENPMGDSMGADDPQAAEQDAETKGVEDDGNAAEGDPCPACGKGILEPPGEAQAEMGEDPEMAAEEGQPGTGDPTTDPDADPDDPSGSDEADPDKGSDNPFASRDDSDEDEDDDGVPDADEDKNDDGIPDSDEENPEDDSDSAPPFESDDPDDDEDEDDPKKKPAGHTPWQR